MTSKLDIVVEILKSPSHDLKELVALSGRSPLRFFNGADLTGLDLSNQNLSGMNFDFADLRLANLKSATYDPGCFNKSVLDESQQWLKDEFEFSAEDILGYPNNQILAFAKFRTGLIDSIIMMAREPFDSFAARAGTSVASLRKARQGKVVAMETAQSVVVACRAVLKKMEEEASSKYGSLLEQPCISILVGGNNTPFRVLTHDALAHLFLIRKLRMRDTVKRYGKNGPSYLQQRDTAEYLRYFEELVDREDLYDDDD